MMPGHGVNPIFFHEKTKIGRLEYLLISDPLRPVTSRFCLISQTPLKWTPYVYYSL